MIFYRSLIFKTSVLIIAAEITILSAVGTYNILRFSAELDDKIRIQVQLPGKLMNAQLLKYESIADRSIMNETVGEHFIDGFVFNSKRKIYYALEKEAVGKDFFAFTRFHIPRWRPDMKETLIQKIDDGANGYMLCLTPLVAYEGAAPFFFCAIKVSTNQIETQKKDIIKLFVMGSLVGVVLTSIIIILFTRYVITKPLGRLENIADHIARGDLEQNLLFSRRDELGSLSASFMRMKEAVRDAMRKLELSERKYRGIFENASEGIIQFSMDGSILTANASLAHILGFDSAKQLIGRRYDFYAETHRQREIVEAVTKFGQIVNYESAVIKKTNEKIYVSENFHIVRHDDQTIAYIEGLVEDITERKNAVEAMRKAKEDAERAYRSKSEFLANISHELRTPLTGILSSVELGHTYDMPREMRELCDIIRNSSYSLLSLVEGMLQFNHSERLSSDREATPFLLEDVLSNVSRSFMFKSQPRLLDLTIDIDTESVPNALVGQHKKLLDVLNRLVENGGKFNRRFPEVHIGITRERQETNKVILRFSVRDNGIGIDAKHIGKIFDEFYQVDSSSTRNYDGIGIGLSVCRHLVNLMDGRIWVESDVGVGSVFYFTAGFETQPVEIQFDMPRMQSRTGHTNEGGFVDPQRKEEFKQMIHELETLFAEPDPVAIKSLGQSIQSLLQTKETDHLMVTIQDYEYEEAREILAHIAGKYL